MSHAAVARPRPVAAEDVGGVPAGSIEAHGRWSRLPWWAQALIVFAASRVLTTLLFLWVATQASTASRAGPHPSLVDLGTAWDGQWYWTVAVDGYPTGLPHAAGGAVATNQWAFLPLFPALVKALSLGSVAAWPTAAVLVSTAFGFGAAVLLALLLRPYLGVGAATFAVALFSVSPLSFVLQTAYAESMGLFLLFAALCLIDRHRYLAALPVAIALAFTRPGVLALALAVGLHLVVRIVRARRGDEPLPRGELGVILLLGAGTALSGFAWTAIAGLVTDVPDAYFQTELAWRALWMGRTEFAYFVPWFFAARFWCSLVLGGPAGAVVGPIVVVLLVLAFAGLLLLPAVRRIGTTNRLWVASYAVYLLAVFFPQSSVFRLLMPMAPLTGALVPRSTTLRVAVLTGSIALQAIWMWCLYGPVQDYWTVP